jgi:hypothetical protein
VTRSAIRFVPVKSVDQQPILMLHRTRLLFIRRRPGRLGGKRIPRFNRLRLRSPSGARDEFLLAATAQNLRKLAKPRPLTTCSGIGTRGNAVRKALGSGCGWRWHESHASSFPSPLKGPVRRSPVHSGTLFNEIGPKRTKVHYGTAALFSGKDAALIAISQPAIESE